MNEDLIQNDILADFSTVDTYRSRCCNTPVKSYTQFGIPAVDGDITDFGMAEVIVCDRCDSQWTEGSSDLSTFIYSVDKEGDEWTTVCPIMAI